MSTPLEDVLSPLYVQYTNVIKPLIAAIEVRYEEFPTPLLNEIRAFNDHVARCFDEAGRDADFSSNAGKAKGHIDRITFDCYKFLNVSLRDDVIKGFERRTRRVDLSAINSGEFYPEYKRRKSAIDHDLKEAKRQESCEDKSESVRLYERVYVGLRELEDFLIDNACAICWARARFTSKRLLSFLGWLASAVVSSSFIPWDRLWAWVGRLV